MYEKTRNSLLDQMIDEVRRGEYMMDILPNASYEFSGQTQASYFANLREQMGSDMANAIFYCGKSFEEVSLLKKWSVDK